MGARFVCFNHRRSCCSCAVYRLQWTGKLPRELSLIPSTAFRKEEANAQNSNGGGGEGSEPNTGPELCPLLPREGTAVASS